MHRHAQSEHVARNFAHAVRLACNIHSDAPPTVGLVLGTGWGQALEDERFRVTERMPLVRLDVFSSLGTLEGHAREIVVGTYQATERETPFVALRGRVHLNERPGADPEIYRMVRLQMEILIALGAKDLILTCAAGGLDQRFRIGTKAWITDFLSLHAPSMPLYAGEFCQPNGVIARDWGNRTLAEPGCYAMLRGPYFEGERDKQLLRKQGADMVGMSMLPEACVAALYKDEGVRVLPLAFITNGLADPMDHDSHVKAAQDEGAGLSALLCQAIDRRFP